MAIDKGNIKTSANYDVKAQKPLDGRAVRPAKADLIKKESWSSDGNTVYVYEGMQVYVQDEKKTYYLKDLSKMFASDFSGWELMGTGGGGITEEKEVYIGSEEPPVGTKVWIDPTGTPSQPSQPSQPSAGVEVIYFLPMGAVDAIRENGIYVFSADEVAEFRKIFSNIENMIIACKYDTTYTLQEDRCHYTAFSQYCMKAEEGVYIEAHFPEATPISNAIQSDTILILEDGDNIVAQL